MKYLSFMIISFIFMGTTLSCAHKNAYKQAPLVQPEFNASPALIIYKTKHDYANLVPVILSADKSRIISYPDPADIRHIPLPTALDAGYLLDNRGINEHVAFLNITYTEYSSRSTAPSKEELWTMILDKDPLLELYNCASAYSYTDKLQQLNAVIKAGKQDQLFKRIK